MGEAVRVRVDLAVGLRQALAGGLPIRTDHSPHALLAEALLTLDQ
jgi:hypothetical protein